jgi:hypothetical protein
MGLLDDAIREHLELKRRRGSDPNEIDRLEREALGPVRRAPHDDFEPALGGEAEPVGRSAGEDAGEDWTEPQAQPSLADHEYGAETDRLEEWEAPERAKAQPERGPVQGGFGVEPDVAAPSTPAPAMPGEAPPAGGSINEADYLEQETVEHDVESEHLDDPERDDMLEETPEFLQDTPDHDRLWFEQRPPRDFDLDG